MIHLMSNFFILAGLSLVRDLRLLTPHILFFADLSRARVHDITMGTWDSPIPDSYCFSAASLSLGTWDLLIHTHYSLSTCPSLGPSLGFNTSIHYSYGEAELNLSLINLCSGHSLYTPCVLLSMSHTAYRGGGLEREWKRGHAVRDQLQTREPKC